MKFSSVLLSLLVANTQARTAYCNECDPTISTRCTTKTYQGRKYVAYDHFKSDGNNLTEPGFFTIVGSDSE